jgi:hypothetical protein
MKLFKPAYEKDPRWQRDDYFAHHPEQCRIYHCVVALRELVKELNAEVVARLGVVDVMPGAPRFPQSIPSLKGELRFKVVEIGKEFAAAQMLLAAGEASEEFKLAEKEYAPLLEAVAKLEAKEEAERVEKQRAEAGLAAACEAAKERALANLESDREVVAARERLERSAIAAS